MNDAKLRWQCRRGMRELDVLLCRYLDNEYPSASQAEKVAFEELLTLPDPVLAGYLLRRERPGEPAIAAILDRLRN